MQRACDIGKKNQMDPTLRKYVMYGAAPVGFASLIAGFYLGFAFVSNEAAIDAPLMEKVFLSTFISISCGAAGMIIGAFIGSTIYRFKEYGNKKSPTA